MIIVSSMGGCGSTSFIAWFRRHIDCNCPYNSEGLPNPGPGANVKGLKHRIKPPDESDKYLPDGKKIERALFLYDSPYDIIPSLFRRRIAVGHAVAITGKRPTHENNLDDFITLGKDSFGFNEQFQNWSNPSIKKSYQRLIVRSSRIWSHLDVIGEFLAISEDSMKAFPQKHLRKSSFTALSLSQSDGIKHIYGNLHKLIEMSEETILL